MHFDRVLEQAVREEILIPDGWMQGRACFGGLVAALLYQHLAVCHVQRPVRSLMISFVAPVTVGPARLCATVLREGGSVTQAECRLIQDGETRALLLGSFGSGRESVIRVEPEPFAPMEAAEHGQGMPQAPGLVPEFTSHFEFNWVEGGMPFSGGGDGRIGGRVRFREPPAGHGVAHLLGLVDAWPPATLPMYPKPAPGSSLTWNIEFLRHEFGSPDWWLYRARTDAAGGGYGHTEARLAGPDGQVVALSRQTIVMFI